MKTIITGILSLFVSVGIAQGTETDIEAMNDMNRHHFDNQEYSLDMKTSELDLYAMEDVKKKKKKKGKKLSEKGKKKKKGFFSKIFGSK